jgi:hypothetical protein
MMRNRRIGRILIITALVLICGYAAFEARGLLEGPVITITEPTGGATVTDDIVMLKGMTEHISSITLNGRPVFISEEGAISEPLALLPGLNIATIIGKDRFGKERTVSLTLVYRPKAADSLPASIPGSTATSSARTTRP